MSEEIEHEETKLTSAEVKLIRLVDRLDVMQKYCEEMSERIESQLAWKYEVKTLEHELEKIQEHLSWAVHLLLGTMFTMSVSLLVFIINHMVGV